LMTLLAYRPRRMRAAAPSPTGYSTNVINLEA
jgi:hypothetical protein